MKNIVIFLLLLTTLGAGFIAAKSKLRIKLEDLEGQTQVIARGNLTLPINSTGAIRQARRIEIKSEASGEVIEIAKHPGDSVKAGDLLIRLKPDDEQRTVDRAQRELDVATARMGEFRVNLEQAKTADIAAARARVEQLEQSIRLAKYRLEKIQGLPDHQKNVEEVLQRDTAYQSQLAQLAEAQATLEKAKLAVRRSEQSLKQAEANLESAKTTLEDAKERLREADIFSPIDGIVGDVFTQIGEVIQGGKTTLTGGTVLAVILDLERLIVRAEVDESDIGRVLAIAPPWAKPGHASSIKMPSDLAEAARQCDSVPTIGVESFRDREFEGVIDRVFPEPKSISNVITYLVDVVITSENRDVLLPGMRATVRFTADHVEDVVLCPNEAISEGSDGRLGVHIPKPDSPPDQHLTEFVAVRIGLDDGAFSEIVEGIQDGDVVYTKMPLKTDSNKDGDKKRS